MRHSSIFSLTLLSVGCLSWYGANRLDLATSQAATLEATEADLLHQSKETSEETGDLAYSPALLPSVVRAGEFPQPSFSMSRGALAVQGVAQGSMSSAVALSPINTKSWGTEIEAQTAQSFSVRLDRDQLKSVVNRLVGDRSPALGAIAATAEAPSNPQPSNPQSSSPQPSVQYALYTQPAESPVSSATLASANAQPAAQFTRTQKATPADTAGSRALAALIARQVFTSDGVADGMAKEVAPAASPNSPAQNIAQVPSLNPATPGGFQTLPTTPTLELPAGNAPSPRTGPANTMPTNSNPANTGPLLPGLFTTGGISTGVDENYILGPGDIIEVIVFNVPEYSGQHRISTSGTINLPLIGRMSVRGMTLNRAGDAIAARYVSQLQTPIVSINVLQQRPMQIAIAGEISQPGLYTLVADGAAYPRVFQALQQAGGLTQSADLQQVEIRRQGVDGRLTTFKVNLLALLRNGDISQNIFLQDGDAVVVPAATAIDQIALDNLAASNLRPSFDQPLNIAIVGAVTQPGPYRLGGEGSPVTVVQALQSAGGIVPSANLKDVQLRRRTRQGDEQVFSINLWEAIQTGDLSQDLALQQGDTLTVPTATDASIEEITALVSSSLSTGTIKVNIVGEVESPGSLDVRANTSFNQALLAAGGLNRRSQNDATLIRFNPNGTVEKREITVDLSQDINAETNPILRPNDVIAVGRSARAAFDDTVSGFSRTFNLVWPFLFLF